jgi:excisionase family DNA binding protein
MVIENKLGPLMTVRDVAQLLNIHNNTVRRWSDRGMIKAYRINDRGDRRFKREEIVRFLSELNTL